MPTAIMPDRVTTRIFARMQSLMKVRLDSKSSVEGMKFGEKEKLETRPSLFTQRATS